MAELAQKSETPATEAAFALFDRVILGKDRRFASGTIFIPSDVPWAAKSIAQAQHEGRQIALVFPDGTAVALAQVVDAADEEPAASSKFVIYTDKSGRWRWKLVLANGDSAASSNESYATKAEAVRAVDCTKMAAAAACVLA